MMLIQDYKKISSSKIPCKGMENSQQRVWKNKMSYENDYLNYCNVHAGDRIHGPLGHNLIYPRLEDSIDKDRTSFTEAEPYCSYCLKTQSVLKEEYIKWQKELFAEYNSRDDAGGLRH